MTKRKYQSLRELDRIWHEVEWLGDVVGFKRGVRPYVNVYELRDKGIWLLPDGACSDPKYEWRVLAGHIPWRGDENPPTRKTTFSPKDLTPARLRKRMEAAKRLATKQEDAAQEVYRAMWELVGGTGVQVSDPDSSRRVRVVRIEETIGQPHPRPRFSCQDFHETLRTDLSLLQQIANDAAIPQAMLALGASRRSTDLWHRYWHLHGVYCLCVSRFLPKKQRGISIVKAEGRTEFWVPGDSYGAWKPMHEPVVIYSIEGGKLAKEEPFSFEQERGK